MKQLSLDRLVAGPQIAGCRMSHNDERHLLVINGRLAALTPTEYLLSMALLRQRERWETVMGQIPLCVSFAELKQISGIQQRKLLAKHLNNASLKLMPLGVRLIGIGGSYMALLEADMHKHDGRQPFSMN
jgi:hypothetical protein